MTLEEILGPIEKVQCGEVEYFSTFYGETRKALMLKGNGNTAFCSAAVSQFLRENGEFPEVEVIKEDGRNSYSIVRRSRISLTSVNDYLRSFKK